MNEREKISSFIAMQFFVLEMFSIYSYIPEKKEKEENF